MNAVSLFSGVGGLDEGLRRAGFRHMLMCESDPWRRGVLRARFPGVTVADDVRGVSAEPAERAAGAAGVRRGAVVTAGNEAAELPDLVCGGFPCQDLSVAGKRAGLNGSRSGLFFEFARIVESLRPRWLLVENVPGLLSSNGGRDFGIVLGTLADLGYGLGWRVLDSRFFGVPQRRRRVFVVGARADGDPRAAAERAGQVLAVGSRCHGHPATRGEAGADVAGTLGGGAGERGWAQDTERMTFVPTAITISGDALRGEGTAKTPSPDAEGRIRLRDPGMAVGEDGDPAFTINATSPGAIAFHPTGGGSKGLTPLDDGTTPGTGTGANGTVAIAQGASVRRLTPTECERLQGLPDGWTRVPDDAPDSRRYAALGDAVTANVAEWIGRRIVAEEFFS